MQTNFHPFQLINIIKGLLGGAPTMDFNNTRMLFWLPFSWIPFFSLEFPLNYPRMPSEFPCADSEICCFEMSQAPHSTYVWIQLSVHFLTSSICPVLCSMNFRFRDRVHVNSDAHGSYRLRQHVTLFKLYFCVVEVTAKDKASLCDTSFSERNCARMTAKQAKSIFARPS